ncbi:hypothetical protein O3M35_004006 [Rhynocoris fuscipes]|uniref:CABIT domain-containing protein n=1 Tax=Rhynocoris fuscipes TaxID=488301 RepID=A0AAW1CKB4_9HEMI
MATDGQVIAAAARWSDEQSYLWQLLEKTTLPAIVKVVKGQYSILGVPSLPCPGLQTTALLVSHGPRRAIIAQPVKIKEGRRVVAVGPRIVIPESYPGYFELLSEEGRGMRAMESVSEVRRRKPECLCLVRQPIRALAGRIESDGTINSAGPRLINSGETIFPIGEVHLPQYKTRFLHCIDSKRENILLGLEQRGRFSVVAKEESISGVHSARNLLAKRMPLTVRLVHGPPPTGLRGQAQFVPELRLLAVSHEEALYALPLQKEWNSVIPVPLGVPLKFQVARNHETLKNLKELQRLIEKCLKFVLEAADKAHVLDNKVSDKIFSIKSGNINATYSHHQLQKNSIQRSPSLNSTKKQINHDKTMTSSVLSQDYDDIDQIYDYVRGFAPLPKNIRLPFSESTPHLSGKSSSNVDKPLPPPIETIPKKIQLVKAEKRTRKDTHNSEPIEGNVSINTNYEKNHYLKNILPSKTRVLRQKISSSKTNKSYNSGLPKNNTTAGRYKSLSDLLDNDYGAGIAGIAAHHENTLNSSNSGGDRASAVDQIVEKKSRTLCRPLSLTNLIYDEKVIVISQPLTHSRTLYL